MLYAEALNRSQASGPLDEVITLLEGALIEFSRSLILDPTNDAVRAKVDFIARALLFLLNNSQ